MVFRSLKSAKRSARQGEAAAISHRAATGSGDRGTGPGFQPPQETEAGRAPATALDDESHNGSPGAACDGSGRHRGPQASAKGLRHGFGIAMLSGDRPLPLNVLRDLLGHTDTKTTEIYLQAIGQERRNLVMQAWDSLD